MNSSWTETADSEKNKEESVLGAMNDPAKAAFALLLGEIDHAK